MKNQELKPSSGLVQAALALEDELRQIVSIATEAQRLPLDSQHNLEFTAGKLSELGTVDQRLQPLVNALMEAVKTIVNTQQAQAMAIKDRADELRRRREVFQKLLTSYGSLVQTAQGLHGLIMSFADTRRNDGAASAENAPSLYVVQQAMTNLIESACQVSLAANEENFKDVARQVDSIRQQLLGARKSLNLLSSAQTRKHSIH